MDSASQPPGVPELLAPAGCLTRLRVAAHYGADAVYVGATVQQVLADHLAVDLDGAIGARQYPEGGEGRIVRPGVPPRP